jgi:2-dehydro-3-deoxy-D-gluconate 5-dehydrogenase
LKATADVTDKAAVAAVVSSAAGELDRDRRRPAKARPQGDRRPARPAAGAHAGSLLATIAVFLASPASDFVTGTAIPIDGGYSVMG